MSIIQGVGSGEVSTGFYPFTISNSLRFNAGDDPFLSRTPSAASNRKTWTWSAWVKRATIDNTVRELFGTAAEGDVLRFTDSRIGWFNNGSASSFLSTSAFFRDPSAWYNIVLAFDTTESTDSDRVKLYVNGTQVAFDNNTTFPGPSYEGDINNTEAQFIGKGHGASEFDGYLAEINFIDGQALGPSSFGETKNDIWVASNLGSFTAATTTVSSFSSGASSITVASATGIAVGQQVEGTGIASSTFVTGVSSTTISLSQNTDGSSSGNYTFGNYGRNGFRLQFAQTGTGTGSSSTVGADTSGNGNHFTSSGLASTDQMLDSPNNNFATLDNLSTVNTGGSLSDGNLTWSIGGADGAGKANFVMTSGKWYCEVGVAGAVSDYVGLVSGNASLVNVNMSQSILYNEGGQYRKNGSMISYGASFASTDIISIALDLDSGTQTVEFFKNNASQGTINLTDVGSEGYAFACGSGSGSRSATFNFGQDSTGISSAQSDENGIGTFEFAPPSGFLALCTANFPNPGIDPNANETPDQYFDTILYQAATSNGTYTRGSIAFTPDWSWIKNRDNAERHLWADVIRGNTSMTDKWLVSDDSAAEGANGVSGTTFSVTSSGYQFVETSIDAGELFFNNRLYVGWNWKAETAFSNDASATGIGTIDSTGRVSTEAGFSIVSYQGNGTDDATVKHGLSQKPELSIIKNRDATTNWDVSFEGITGGTSLNLDTDADVFTPTLGNHERGTQVLTLKDGSSGRTRVNTNSENYIAYCFHSVDGYSKISTYKGNGNADGTFVYTGFRPAWLMIKRFDSGSESWNIVDNKRNPLNGAKTLLRADVVNQEVDATNGIDLLSNGFKVRDNIGNYNTSSADYLYMAFADQPFKYSNAR